MDYKDFIKDFSRRTFRNLKTTCDHKSAYEVTHLLNSCLGLIVFPEQEYFDTQWLNGPDIDFPNPQIESTARKVGVCPQKLKGGRDCRCTSHYGHLLRHLRNALAHGRIKTSPDVLVEKIEKICFTDQQEDRGTGNIITIDIELTIGELFNVVMSVLYLTLGKDENKFKAEEPEKCAKNLKVNLDVYGIRWNFTDNSPDPTT